MKAFKDIFISPLLKTIILQAWFGSWLLSFECQAQSAYLSPIISTPPDIYHINHNSEKEKQA